MANSYYFSHDYSSRQDSKIKRLLFKHGMQGYGLYWALIEDLYANNNKIPYDIEMMSYNFRVSPDKVKSVLEDFGLFEIQDNTVSSNSVSRRLELRDNNSTNAKKAAKARWGEEEKRKKAINTIFYVVRIFSKDEEFIKAGITSESVSRRFSGKLNGYEYELIFQIDTSTENAIAIENAFQNNFTPYVPSIKFFGSNECYSILEYPKIKDFAMQEYEIAMPDIELRNAIKEKKGNEIKGNSKYTLEYFEQQGYEFNLPKIGHDAINRFLEWREKHPSHGAIKSPQQVEAIIIGFRNKNYTAEQVVASVNKTIANGAKNLIMDEVVSKPKAKTTILKPHPDLPDDWWTSTTLTKEQILLIPSSINAARITAQNRAKGHNLGI